MLLYAEFVDDEEVSTEVKLLSDLPEGKTLVNETGNTPWSRRNDAGQQRI